jgi:2-methylisocitrate lyase-like PEP mutase family enzyme
MANIIKGGLTETLSAQMLAEIGFAMAVYPFPFTPAKIKAVKDTLEEMKTGFKTDPPPQAISFSELCQVVGFKDY